MSTYCPACLNFMDITNLIPKTSEMVSSSSNEGLTTNNDYLTNYINDILNGKTEGVSDKKIKSIEDIYENDFFQSLTEDKQTLVINRFLKNNTSLNTSNSNIFYYYCNNCGHHEQIPNKSLIFQDKSEVFIKNILNYKYDITHPTTKKYSCINEKCETHNDPTIKKASMVKLDQNKYELTFICHVCDATWIN